VLQTTIQSGFARTRSEALFPRLFPDAGWWCPSLQSPGGTRLHDLRGSNWGTLTNMTPASDWVVNGGRGALDFDGVNDTVSLPGTSSLTPSTITFSGWFRRPSTWEITGNCLFWAKPNASFDGNGFYVEPCSSSFSNNTLVVTNGAATSYLRLNQPGNTSFALNTWTHFAFTLARGAGQFYLNGLPFSTSVVGTPAITGTNDAKYLYSNSPGYGNFTPGQADDIRIFRSVLTAADFREIYQLGRGNMPMLRRRRYTEEAAGFKAYWARRQSQLIGGGV